ncbi:Spore coat protein [Turicibacter sanguinis]|nr:Spore coat protein [Turicibacter sanguinis]
MNHLGKENSFSFQRTIHALNEGLKLIIRGGTSMNDRDLMEDVLLVVKGAADLYLHGTIESSTLNVHSTFEKVLNDTLCMQNEIYNLMAQKGWYPTQSAEQQQIDQVKQKYAQAAGQGQN